MLQLVPAVTELIIAELLYLQYKDRTKPIFLYINSTGTTRADGETVCQGSQVVMHAATVVDPKQFVLPLLATLTWTGSHRLALRQKAQQFMTPCSL